MYIPLVKLAESKERVEYSFKVGESILAPGVLRLDKRTGQVKVVREAAEQNEFCLPRAQRKLELHWRAGEYPSESCWAS